jgi:hypothetical protein
VAVLTQLPSCDPVEGISSLFPISPPPTPGTAWLLPGTEPLVSEQSRMNVWIVWKRSRNGAWIALEGEWGRYDQREDPGWGPALDWST